MEIPFVGGAYLNRSSNINAQECTNLFVSVDNKDAKAALSLLGTPGCKSFSQLGTVGSVRRLFAVLTKLYVVVDNSIYTVNTNGECVLLGTITTSAGNVFMESNGVEVLIVDGTEYGYFIDATDTVTAVTLPCKAGCLTFQDGYFIVTEVGTGNFFISGLYDASSWDSLDFGSTEASPDSASAIISNTHDLWIIGKQTSEVFYNSGDADFPFTRISGAVLEVGTNAPASVVKIDNLIYWLSDKGQIVRSEGYQYAIISTPHIEYMLSKFTTLSDAKAYLAVIEGLHWYVITFPTDARTLIYNVNTGFWSELKSYSNKDDAIPWSKHRSNCGVYFNTKTVVGDYENGKLYTLDMDTYADDDYEIQRRRTSQTISKERVLLLFHNLEVEFEAGVGLDEGLQGENPQVCLDWSDDGGHTWSNEHWRSIGRIGKYKYRTVWKRLGKSRNRIFRLTMTDKVKVVILGATANIEECK